MAPFSKEDKILIISLSECKGYNARQFITKFPDKGWTNNSINRLLVKSRKFGTVSSKVDDFGTNRNHVYDFLLVGHCDYCPVLHRFRDMVTYWLKIAYFWYIFATPLSFGALVPYVPLGILRRS